MSNRYLVVLLLLSGKEIDLSPCLINNLPAFFCIENICFSIRKIICPGIWSIYYDFIVDIDNKYEGIDGLFLEDFRNYMKRE